MNLTLTPRSVLRFLLIVIAVLTACNLFAVVAVHGFGHERLFGLRRLFDINRESNLPSYFSSLQLAFAAFVTLAIAQTKRAAGARFGAHWLTLSAILAFLAIDEATSIHETIGDVMRNRLVLQGFLAYAWYIPYSFLLIVFAIAFWHFFWGLPTLVRLRFAGAAALFLVGAVGLEIVGSYLWSVTHWHADTKALRLAVAYSVEELLEMLGIAWFVYSALGYAATQAATAHIVFGADAPPRVAALRAPAAGGWFSRGPFIRQARH